MTAMWLWRSPAPSSQGAVREHVRNVNVSYMLLYWILGARTKKNALLEMIVICVILWAGTYTYFYIVFCFLWHELCSLGFEAESQRLSKTQWGPSIPCSIKLRARSPPGSTDAGWKQRVLRSLKEWNQMGSGTNEKGKKERRERKKRLKNEPGPHNTCSKAGKGLAKVHRY